jgi:N-alpha-acetyltransferase 30
MASKSKKNKKNKGKEKGGDGATNEDLANINDNTTASSENPLYDLTYAPFFNPSSNGEVTDVIYGNYEDEAQLSTIQEMAARDLSEPYSVFTYRYFLLKWPELCLCAYARDETKADKRGPMIGTILCKLDPVDEADPSQGKKGYIGMLIVDKTYRKRGIGQRLSIMAMNKMVVGGVDQIVLETEASNKGALGLYQKLGFVKEEKLPKYYLSMADAFRLKLTVDRRYLQEE